ncbi:MAG: UDP-galactopyranose mutase [Mesorhizobium amorphae]|nr:MAG: UDP-galactopyranose mutase [Mesorhizobium amorphae]
MSRFAHQRRVFFFEEAIPCDHHLAYLEYHPFDGTDVVAVRPRVPHWWDEAEREKGLRGLLELLVKLEGGQKPVLWFYTPMMFGFAAGIEASAVVYDCMDELANFRFAPERLKELERALLRRADAVFTGGVSLYEAKRGTHDNIYPFPSSVDVAHFAAARGTLAEPADQRAIPHPRVGFYGVIDERMDLGLLGRLADARPEWSLVMLGPMAKIDPADLPRRQNIFWLGQKSYDELPAYLSGWDLAMMPFAVNEATRFISPTKTPEYLAAGCPVLSTPIADVVRSYGGLSAVAIAADADGFARAGDKLLAARGKGSAWRDEADAMLARQSWDETFERMDKLIGDAVARNRHPESALPRPAIRRPSGRKPYDVLVVGAGFAGSVMAERLAREAGKRVLVMDRRPHIAGNAFDHHDAAGILVHRYGPHIFHTNSDEIFSYLSRFTAWRGYEHRVLAAVGDKRVPMPINRTTLNALYGANLQDDEAAARFLAARAEPQSEIRSSRDVVVAQVGTELYETFFQGYTRKQWGLDPSALDKSVTARVPTRVTTDDRYFLDAHQAMPLHGYTRMFENMLDHDRIEVSLGADFAELRHDDVAGHTIFTGPIDEFFGHRFGPLPYRCLEFRHETHDQRRFQEAAVVNYPSEDVPYTRITEYKYLTGQVSPKTSISYEFSRADGDPYYPIPRAENQALFKRYEALANDTPDTTFLGRLGTYRYYNMDQVVGQALATFRRMGAKADMVAQKAVAGV